MKLKLRPKFVLVQMESFQETQHADICCLWGCIDADHSKCRPLSTAESTNNEHKNTTIRPQSNGSRCVEVIRGFVLQNLKSMYYLGKYHLLLHTLILGNDIL